MYYKCIRRSYYVTWGSHCYDSQESLSVTQARCFEFVFKSELRDTSCKIDSVICRHIQDSSWYGMLSSKDTVWHRVSFYLYCSLILKKDSIFVVHWYWKKSRMILCLSHCVLAGKHLFLSMNVNYLIYTAIVYSVLPVSALSHTGNVYFKTT